MINVVRPNALGTIDQFTELFKSPIECGKFLEDFVHREEKVLQSCLPPRYDYVLLLKMISLQKSLNDVVASFVPNILTAYSFHQKIVNHPDVFQKSLVSPKEEKEELNEELVGELDTNNDGRKDMENINMTGFKKSALDLLASYDTYKIENSPKMEILFAILKESAQLNDQVVLFSQSLATLDLIEHFLQSEFRWILQLNYFRFDGSTTMTSRQAMISEFNLNPKISLFLISTKAGGLGINLCAANRVILYDVPWNPCFDMQAVSRVHRMGQKRPVFIYRFVTQSCLEETVYNHQIYKQAMSARVVDRLQSNSNLSVSSKFVRFDSNFEDIEYETSSLESDPVIRIIFQNIPQLAFRHGIF